MRANPKHKLTEPQAAGVALAVRNRVNSLRALDEVGSGFAHHSYTPEEASKLNSLAYRLESGTADENDLRLAAWFAYLPYVAEDHKGRRATQERGFAVLTSRFDLNSTTYTVDEAEEQHLRLLADLPSLSYTSTPEPQRPHRRTVRDVVLEEVNYLQHRLAWLKRALRTGSLQGRSVDLDEDAEPLLDEGSDYSAEDQEELVRELDVLLLGAARREGDDEDEDEYEYED